MGDSAIPKAQGHPLARSNSKPMLSPDFLQSLREINRYRLLDRRLGPQTPNHDMIELTPTHAAILALLCELDPIQRAQSESRIEISRIGGMLGLNRNSISTQIGFLGRKGLCEELQKGSSQDRRMRFYIVTERGRAALDQFLDQTYKLDDDVYHGAGMTRARKVLKRLKEKVALRVTQHLSGKSDAL